MNFDTDYRHIHSKTFAKEINDDEIEYADNEIKNYFNFKEEKEKDVELENLIEQVEALYGVEYNYSNISKDILNEMYNDAISCFSSGQPMKDVSCFIKDIELKKETTKNTKKEKKEEKEKSLYWDKNFSYPFSFKDNNDAILEIDMSGCPQTIKDKITDLFMQYLKFANKNNINGNILELSQDKFSICFEKAFGTFKFENGIHNFKFQNYISNVKVNVFPVTDKVELKDLNIKDVKIDTFRSSGAGGQHVNKTSSAVRATHIPTGIVVVCQNERSQIFNKNMAIKILNEKVQNFYKSEQNDLVNKILSECDINEKIRTYDFNNNKFLDNRIHFKTSLNDFNNIDFNTLYQNLIEYGNMKKEQNIIK